MVGSNIPSNPINVLLVEDDAGSRKLVRRALQDHDPDVSYEISEAADLASAIKLLAEGNFDNVILDLRLPDSTGLETLRSIKETDPDVPVVVLSAISDHETAVNSIRYGADYYIVKGDMLRQILGRSVCFSIERKRRELEIDNQDKLQNHVDQLQHQISEIKESLTDQISSVTDEERTIRQLNAEHQQFVDILPAMIWQIDKKGVIVRINAPAAGLIEKNTTELIGKDFYRLFACNDDHARMKHELILADGIAKEESMEAYKSSSGSLVYHLTEVVPYREKTGVISGLVIIARDSVSENELQQKTLTIEPGKSIKQLFTPETSFMARKAGAIRIENTDKPQKQYSGKVLVVDHDSLNRMLIGSHFKGSGLEVEFAVSGLQAIEKSQSENFDLVLTALIMPELDGLEVVYKLRKDEFMSPVIVMTSDHSEQAIENIRKSGSEGHIFKPINKKDLFAVLDKYLPVTAATQ